MFAGPVFRPSQQLSGERFQKPWASEKYRLRTDTLCYPHTKRLHFARVQPIMKFGKRIGLFFARPIYRSLFEAPLTDIGTRLQNVERLSSQLHDAEANLAAQLHKLRAELVPYLQRAEASNTAQSAHLHNFSERLRGIEGNSANEARDAARWSAIEELILALLRQPDSSVVELDSAVSTSKEALADINGLNATSHLR